MMERQTLLNMIDMHKPAGSVVDAFENPYYAANGMSEAANNMPAHAHASHIVVLRIPSSE